MKKYTSVLVASFAAFSAAASTANESMSNEGQSLEVKILQGAGSGELENISGELEIVKEGDVHKYELTYQL